MSSQDTIAILDFGSQYTHLIARRVRELGVFSRIYPSDTPAEELENSRGIILSGGPDSIGDEDHPFDKTLLHPERPVLGVCYGMQLLNRLDGGEVRSLEKGEYGGQKVEFTDHPLFCKIEGEQQAWMSHRDSVARLGDHYRVVGKSQDGLITAIAHKEKPHFGLQFHPEVDHTPCGRQLLENFVDLCHCDRSYKLENYLERAKEKIRAQVGDGTIISLVSGGVDSTVATAICCQAIGPERVHAVTIDSGLLRKNELEQVVAILTRQGLTHLHVEDARDRFLSALSGLTEAESKRKAIGRLFIEVLESKLRTLPVDPATSYLCQGTLYTDLIESGKGCGNKANVIKSHHNVGCALIEEKRASGMLVEPNEEIFKDEVRRLGLLLDLPREQLWRHPFPGPGLGIRIMGEVTEERLRVLREADAIAIEEIRSAGLYDQIWQALCVLLPIDTVGVKGDKRAVGQVIALRCINSNDGMTASCSTLPWDLLQRIASRIPNEVPEICRVVYDITSKPPGTIEWE